MNNLDGNEWSELYNLCSEVEHALKSVSSLCRFGKPVRHIDNRCNDSPEMFEFNIMARIAHNVLNLSINLHEPHERHPNCIWLIRSIRNSPVCFNNYHYGCYLEAALEAVSFCCGDIESSIIRYPVDYRNEIVSKDTSYFEFQDIDIFTEPVPEGFIKGAYKYETRKYEYWVDIEDTLDTYGLNRSTVGQLVAGLQIEKSHIIAENPQQYRNAEANRISDEGDRLAEELDSFGISYDKNERCLTNRITKRFVILEPRFVSMLLSALEQKNADRVIFANELPENPRDSRTVSYVSQLNEKIRTVGLELAPKTYLPRPYQSNAKHD